jgi:hypothetical protein
MTAKERWWRVAEAGIPRGNVSGMQTPSALCGISVGSELVALREAVEATTFHLVYIVLAAAGEGTYWYARRSLSR